ncbi:hypothetical protein ACLK19_22830 [Escherichia coli]
MADVIYIDVNAVEDFHLSQEAQAWWQSPTTQQTLQQARDADWVDYSTVTALKIQHYQWRGKVSRNVMMSR